MANSHTDGGSRPRSESVTELEEEETQRLDRAELEAGVGPRPADQGPSAPGATEKGDPRAPEVRKKTIIGMNMRRVAVSPTSPPDAEQASGEQSKAAPERKSPSATAKSKHRAPGGAETKAKHGAPEDAVLRRARAAPPLQSSPRSSDASARSFPPAPAGTKSERGKASVHRTGSLRRSAAPNRAVSADGPHARATGGASSRGAGVKPSDPRRAIRPLAPPPPGITEGKAAPPPAIPEGEAEQPGARSSLFDLEWLEDEEEASVLLVGAGHQMEAALSAALARHGLYVELSGNDAVIDAIVAATPSVVVLVGDAVKDNGVAVLDRLQRADLGRALSVVVLLDAGSFQGRLEAYRHGATTVLPHSASVDAVAEQVARIAKVKGQGEAGSASIGDTSLSDLLAGVGDKLREELAKERLPEATAVAPEAIRLYLDEGHKVVRVIDDFTDAMMSVVVDAEHSELQLGPRDVAAELLGEQERAKVNSDANVASLRVVLGDPNAARADRIAQALRHHGATVVVTGLAPPESHFARLRQLDPMVMLVPSEAAEPARQLIERMQADSRLGWANVLVASWDDTWSHDAGRAVDDLLGRLAASGEIDRSIQARVESATIGTRFDTRLEGMGPARCLRALAGFSGVCRVSLQNRRVSLEVDISDGVLVGAAGQIHDEPPRGLEGLSALAAWLVQSSGRIEVQRIAEPARVNVMDAVEGALAMAESEQAPVSDAPVPARATRLRDMGSLAPAAAPAASADSTRAPHSLLPATQTPSSDIAGRLRELKRDIIAALKHDRRVQWLSVAGVAMAVAVVALIMIALNSSPSVPEASVPEARSDKAASAASTFEPKALDAPEPKATSLLERARAGDERALAELEAKEDKTIEEALALSEGTHERRRQELAELIDAIKEDPSLLENSETTEALVRAARNPALDSEALSRIASLPGAASADLIYEVWVGTPERTPATKLAQELVYTEAVRSKASPALSVALGLRKAEECEEFEALLPEAQEYGDQRSHHLLLRLLKRVGCGPRKRSDCYLCLRPNREITLRQAIEATRGRDAPEL